MKLTFALAFLAGTAVWAADPTPLDMKTGEWEYTVTMQMGGMPGAPAPGASQMPSIPPETLAKMPPAQRAQVEAALARAGNMAAVKPTTTTSKNCVKKEDLTKLNPGGRDQSCKMTVVSSTRTKMEMKMDCDSNGNKETGNMVVEALSQESMKFTLKAAGSQNGQAMNMTVNGTGKFLSATCTDTK